jgi:phosphatidylserine/phosphatidylglycerophosphate/cardiolipin synthase-like enzyme
MASEAGSGRFSFFISRDHIVSFAKLFGPQDDGSFSTGLVLNVEQNALLFAPCDCIVRIVEDPESSVGYLALKLNHPSYVLRELKWLGAVSEMPKYILFRSSEIHYKGLETAFLTDYLGIPPRNTVESATLPDELRSAIANNGHLLPFASGEELGRTAGTTLTLEIRTSPQIRSWKDSPADSFWPDIERRNLMDPLAFWHGLVRGQDVENIPVFLTQNDFDDSKFWFDSDTNTPGRIVLEIRNEHNIPTSDFPQDFEISSSPLGFFESYSPPSSSIILSSATDNGFTYLDGNRTNIGLRSIITGSDELSEQFVFWDLRSSSAIIKETSSTVSVGSPAHIVFQALQPAHWFAEQQADVEDGWSQLKRYTTGNKITPLIDGDQYFEDLQYNIRKVDGARSGDFIHIACWHIERDFDLTGENTTLLDLLAEQSQTPPYPPYPLRAKRVKILKWDMPWVTQAQFPEYFSINAFKSLGADAALDMEGLPLSEPFSLPNEARVYTAYAHHMKLVTINSADGIVAYCGGMDIVSDRLGGQDHKESKGFAGGIHDVQMKVEGPAAIELEHVFWMRWESNSITTPYYEDPYLLPAGNGTGIVQVACTMPNVTPPSKMARHGDLTFTKTLMNGIRNAKQYIYIEDQYFWNPAIAKLLRNKLKDLDFVVVVVPKKPIPAESLGYIGDDHSREQIMEMILEDSFPYEPGEDRANLPRDEVKRKMRVCYLEDGKEFNLSESLWFLSWLPRPDTTKYDPFIYVHAKLMIIDDIFVFCGSSNLDARGLGTDLSGKTSTECNLMCLDERITLDGARRLARDLRIRLWAEHIDEPISPDSHIETTSVFRRLTDPQEAFEICWKAPPVGKIRLHPAWEG